MRRREDRQLQRRPDPDPPGKGNGPLNNQHFASRGTTQRTEQSDCRARHWERACIFTFFLTALNRATGTCARRRCTMTRCTMTREGRERPQRARSEALYKRGAQRGARSNVHGPIKNMLLEIHRPRGGGRARRHAARPCTRPPCASVPSGLETPLALRRPRATNSGRYHRRRRRHCRHCRCRCDHNPLFITSSLHLLGLFERFFFSFFPLPLPVLGLAPVPASSEASGAASAPVLGMASGNASCSSSGTVSS